MVMLLLLLVATLGPTEGALEWLILPCHFDGAPSMAWTRSLRANTSLFAAMQVFVHKHPWLPRLRDDTVHYTHPANTQ